MERAYDAVFRTEVGAGVISKLNSADYGERYRFKCLCCGEEVFLAAAESKEKSPHFRHRRGNNDTECERYLRSNREISTSIVDRRKNQDNVGFFFNQEKFVFEIGISISEEEFVECSSREEILSVYTEYNGSPRFSIPINEKSIVPGRTNYFVLDEYSPNYSVSYRGKKTEYSEVIKKNGRINVYKSNMQGEHCRQNVSGSLFTDTSYYAITERKDYLITLGSLLNINLGARIFSFDTQKKQYYGLQFVIKFADDALCAFFFDHDYRVETAEKLDIIWPPAKRRNGIMYINRAELLIYSSFSLIPHGNINREVGIEQIDNLIYRLNIEEETIIHEKNIDETVNREDIIEVHNNLIEPTIRYENIFFASGEYDYYLFDVNGCTLLSPNQKVYLASNDRIVGYRNGHIVELIYGIPERVIPVEELIQDVLKYHPQSEVFDPDDFMGVESNEVVLKYLEECYKSGRINTVIKRYIMEGKI